MNPIRLSSWMGVLLLVVTGCSTLQSRIKEHPDLFSSLPADVQTRLEAGQIAVGDTKEMVYIALGRPDTKLSRTDHTGKVFDIWSYSGVYYTRDTVWLYPSPFRHRYRNGGSFFYTGPEFIEVQHEYERLRVEFDAEKVKAFDQVQR